MSTEPATRDEIRTHSHERRTELVITLLLAIFFGGCTFTYWLSKEQKTYLVTVIFVLPLIQIGLSALWLGPAWTRYRWVLAGGGLHVAFWGFYIASVWYPWLKAWFPVLYIMCLLAFFLAVVFVFALTSYLIGQRDGNDIILDLENHPLLTISSFLVLFLFVTFFLTFAMAFHDGSSTGRGLFVKQFTATEKLPENREGITRTLWFDEGMAGLQIDSDFDDIPSKRCNIFKGDPLRLKKCLNCVALREVLEKLNSYRSHEHIRVVVMGHANDKAFTGRQFLRPGSRVADKMRDQPIPRYQSNFELAAARMYHVQYLLDERLNEHSGSQGDDHNIEWLLSPVSNEETFLSPITRNNTYSLDPKLSVEIGVIPVPGHLTELQMLELKRSNQSLELLDYLYFMVYTVTTTGYGDIIPISPSAKFMTILANLFELFFSVVFLNVLIACSRERSRPPVITEET